jgi:hypothetical protein
MERKVKTQVQGFRTQDGAGVSLVRVLGHGTVDEYDPLLMLDSFDSIDPSEYTAGFPLHPHRGIETISYIYKGRMLHRDSMGHEDRIGDGEIQWMTAGSGILHEEQLPASERMLGVQLWLNLPAKDKMVPPAYRSIKTAEIQEIPFSNGKIRLLAGRYGDYVGFESHYLPLDYYDVHLNAGAAITIPTDPRRSIMIFTLVGEATIGGTVIPEKTAVKLTEGDQVVLKANDEDGQILFVSSTRLDEPVAWGGPIVMNTRTELQKAFDDLNNGTFLQQDMAYD